MLDGVDAEISLQIQFEIEHLNRIAGFCGNELQHFFFYRIGCSGRCRSRFGFDRYCFCRCRCQWLLQIGTPIINELDRVRQCREIAQFERVIARDIIRSANRGKHFGLLHSVDAEISLQIQFEIEHLQRIAGFFRDKLQDFFLHLIGFSSRCRSRLGFDRDCYCRCCRHWLWRDGGRRYCCHWLGYHCRRHSRRRALIFHAQRAMIHFQFRRRITGDTAQPIVPNLLICDAIAITELDRIAMFAIGGRNPSHQAHANLRTESGAEPQRIAHRINAALGEIKRAQLGIDFFEIRHRRHDTGFQNLDRQHIFDADRHRMAGVAFGISDDNLIGGVTKHRAQCIHFRRGAAAARRCIRFVRNKHGLSRNLITIDAPLCFRLGNQLLHHLANVIDIKTAAVKSAVGGNRAEHVANGLNAAFARRLRTFNDQRRSAHADDQAVAPAVERRRGLFNNFIRGRGAGSEKTGAKPLHQIIGSHVVGRDDDHAAAAAALNPILRERNRLRRAGTGAIDLRVRPARADVFGKLRMSHRQHAEQKTAIKMIRFLFHFSAQ
ncbi:MAG: hypothetical protein ALAOOOJD_04614 [bacterium]|nr:hypothetical protein [bacterium]